MNLRTAVEAESRILKQSSEQRDRQFSEFLRCSKMWKCLSEERCSRIRVHQSDILLRASRSLGIISIIITIITVLMFLPHWCSYHILTSSVIYYWTDARQHGIYLFYIIKKIFQHNSKAGLLGLCPLWRTQKKPFYVICCLYKMKQSHWLLCVSKNCDWSRKITPLSHLTRKSLLVEWKLTAKTELSCDIIKS